MTDAIKGIFNILATPFDTALQVDVDSFLQLSNAAIQEDVSDNPELARIAAEEKRAQAAVALERARAHPDPTFSAGVRAFHEYDETAFVLGVSIPLTLWDDNSAAISRAVSETTRTRLQAQALKRGLEREVASARRQIEIARAEIEAIDQRLLPAAEAAVVSADAGYARGGFSYLDVLDAQRVLADARLRRIDALHAYHHARLELIRLTGAEDERAAKEPNQ